MSTPEQPANPPLTRKQMREIRNTGSNPIITPEAAAEAAAGAAVSPAAAPAPPATPPVPPMPAAPTWAPAQPTAPYQAAAPAQPAAPYQAASAAPAPVAVAPLARPADPIVVPPAPVADSDVDLGASPLTRRQARQQERIRTASVPVITPEVAAAHTASVAAPLSSVPPLTRTDPVSLNSGMHDLFGLATAPAPVVPAPIAPTPIPPAPAAFVEPARVSEPIAVSPEPVSPWSEIRPAEPQPEAEEPQKDRVVSPQFGAGLLAGEPEEAEIPASFDQLLSRSTGSISIPNALILSQAPEVSPIAPLSSTGEVLITGTFNLPEGLGSTGHARGTADGKEVDATLVDGELPAHSSPTPIAASAAISTVKTPGDVIKPPVPEKGSKLMLTLAITAGALALALVGVLIIAFATGVL